MQVQKYLFVPSYYLIHISRNKTLSVDSVIELHLSNHIKTYLVLWSFAGAQCCYSPRLFLGMGAESGDLSVCAAGSGHSEAQDATRGL